MEDTTLTLEQIEHVPQMPREFSSVRIREFDDSTANPEPIAQDEEADQLLEEFLSPSKLVGFSKFWVEKHTQWKVSVALFSLTITQAFTLLYLILKTMDWNWFGLIGLEVVK